MKVRVRALRLTKVASAAWVASLLAVACGSTATTSTSPTPQLTTIQSGYVTIATYGTFAPDIIVGPGDALSGLDGDWLTQFAKDNNLKIKVYPTTFSGGILAVQQSKADMFTYLYYTDARGKVVYYTYPFNLEKLAVYVRKGFSYSSPDSLKGKKVGAVLGEVQSDYVQKAWGSNAVTLPSDEAAEAALLNGQIDGWVSAFNGATNGSLNAGNSDYHFLKEGDFGVPASAVANLVYNIVNCNNKGLADAANSTLKKLHSQGKWSQILTKYTLSPENDVSLSSPGATCSG